MNPEVMFDKLMLLLDEYSCICTSGCKGCPLHKYVMVDADNCDLDICDVIDTLKRKIIKQ